MPVTVPILKCKIESACKQQLGSVWLSSVDILPVLKRNRISVGCEYELGNIDQTS